MCRCTCPHFVGRLRRQTTTLYTPACPRVLHVVLVATKADDADTAGALRFTATTVVAGDCRGRGRRRFERRLKDPPHGRAYRGEGEDEGARGARGDEKKARPRRDKSSYDTRRRKAVHNQATVPPSAALANTPTKECSRRSAASATSRRSTPSRPAHVKSEGVRKRSWNSCSIMRFSAALALMSVVGAMRMGRAAPSTMSTRSADGSVAYLLNIRILGPVAPLTGQYSRGGLN